MGISQNSWNQVTYGEKKVCRTMARDEDLGFRAAHWADLYSLLHGALPPGIILWGHQFLRSHNPEGVSFVRVQARVLSTSEVVEITGNLLVAADGCLSSVRRQFLPDFKLRYSGYSAWRGVLDFSGKENSEMITGLRRASGKENSEMITGLRRAYPELGNCLYFDLAHKTHCVLYELKNKRINWIWYINQPEPEIKGNSVTMKVSENMIKKMNEDAEGTWVSELARVIKETKEPFINVIYDSDPLPQLLWGNMVLVGDAAHPTSPHGLMSTNMSILDAGVLGCCLEKSRLENLASALEKFESIRLPVVSRQVLHSRHMGRVKQGLSLPGHRCFDPNDATQEDCTLLQQRNMPFFGYAPLLV
uniref:Salicylate hydroxylase n=2 Tax=Anthurium amnicola TaxID=1678845 RepID=A0A1D1XP61_9ARAE